MTAIELLLLGVAVAMLLQYVEIKRLTRRLEKYGKQEAERNEHLEVLNNCLSDLIWTSPKTAALMHRLGYHVPVSDGMKTIMREAAAAAKQENKA